MRPHFASHTTQPQCTPILKNAYRHTNFEPHTSMLDTVTWSFQKNGWLLTDKSIYSSWTPIGAFWLGEVTQSYWKLILKPKPCVLSAFRVGLMKNIKNEIQPKENAHADYLKDFSLVIKNTTCSSLWVGWLLVQVQTNWQLLTQFCPTRTL